MDQRMNARLRWRMLADVLKGKKTTCSVSVDWTERLMNILFLMSVLDYQDDLVEQSDRRIQWIELTPKIPGQNNDTTVDDIHRPRGSLHLRTYTGFRHVEPHRRLELLSGFDNTGNVNLWSSELLLAHALYYPQFYPGLWQVLNPIHAYIRTVCELGAGMTGAAGLSAICSPHFTDVDTLLLTDGNDDCVASLKAVVGRNVQIKAQLRALKLLWPSESAEVQLPDPELCQHFQLIVASDCLFHTSGHKGFLQLIDVLLTNDSRSTCLIAAPRRGSTLDQFITVVRQHPRWTVNVLAPEEFIGPTVLERLLSELDDCSVNTIQDTLLSHLIILRRQR